MGVKISNLPNNALPYSGSELIPMVQSGETRAGSLSSFASLLSGVLLADTELAQLSGVWQSTYTTTQANSARWTSSYTTTQANSGNWSSVYNNVNSLSASWEESADILPTVTNYLSSNNVLLSSVTVTDYIKDGANIIAIEPNNRKLITSAGSTLLDWSNTGAYGVEFSNGASLETNALFFADGSSNYYSIQESTLKDATNQVGVNWASRELIADDGLTAMLDWTSSTVGVALGNGIPLGVDIIYDAGSPLNYIDMVNGEIGGYSGSNVPSIDWVNRTLIGSDGTAIIADWNDTIYLKADKIQNLAAGSCYIDVSTGSLNDSGTQTVDWCGRLLNSGGGSSNVSSVDWDARQLIGSNGSTIAADWSTGTPDFPQGFSTSQIAPLATDAGTPGQMVFTDDYIYRCFATGDWRRVGVSYTTY